jgi:acetyltransferase-like isoleucine patch superfamily enzyme
VAPLDREALNSLGLRSIGSDVQVDETVQVFGAQHVEIGSHVRIDCFAVITAGPKKVSIGNYVHLGVGACLFGTAGIQVGDFTSLSSRVSVYSTDDDYGSGRLSGPMVPLEYRSVHSSPVVLERHTLVGAGSVILPGVRICPGSAVGALSMVKGDVGEGELVAGVPARFLRRRNVGLLRELEERVRSVEMG